MRAGVSCLLGGEALAFRKGFALSWDRFERQAEIKVWIESQEHVISRVSQMPPISKTIDLREAMNVPRRDCNYARTWPLCGDGSLDYPQTCLYLLFRPIMGHVHRCCHNYKSVAFQVASSYESDDVFRARNRRDNSRYRPRCVHRLAVANETNRCINRLKHRHFLADWS